MRNGIPFLFVLFASVALLLSLTPPIVQRMAEGVGGVSLTDMTGRMVILPASPQRLAIYPPVLPSYLTIDKGPTHIVGDSQVADNAIYDGIFGELYPRAVSIKEISKGVGPENSEALLFLHPDAVLVWPGNVSFLAQLGIPGIVSLRGNPNDPTDATARLWSMLGVLAGKDDRALRLLQDWKKERESLSSIIPQAHPELKIAILYGGVGIGQIGGRYAHLNSAIHFIGARNPADTFPVTTNSNLEQLLSLDPDIILLTGEYARSPRDLYSDPAWQPLRAVQGRRIYQIPRLADINGPVDDPLFILWLAAVAYGGKLPYFWRDDFRQTYQKVYDVPLSDKQIDRMLRMGENSASSGYDHFLSPGATHAPDGGTAGE